MSALLYSEANADLNALRAIPTPAPRGRFHQPYPFATYVEDVSEALDRIGYEVLRDEYEVTPDRQAFFGALEIAPVTAPVASPVYREVEGELLPANDSDFRLLVGLRGSHDQRLPRGLVLGSQVLVCSNLCFSGNIGSFTSKQTKYLHQRLPRLINETVARIPELAHQQENKFDAYKSFEFSNARHGDAALVEIYRQHGLSASQLGKAIHEWDRPSYEEHAAHGKSAWLLLNSVTEALKPTGTNVNHNTIAQRTAIADRFISNLVGVTTLAEAA